MLVLSDDVYDEMLAHATAGAPEEVCGVLGGTFDSERSVARTSHRADNVAEMPDTTYEIDPEEQLSIMTAIEDAGHDVVGFYHSHPAGPAGPSQTDVAQATWEGYSYVIASLDGESPSVGSWRWEGEEFEHEPTRID